MIRLRFHGRGGQGAKVASRILGTAAFLEGHYAQDFPLYGAERRGAPIAAFTRISKEPILERGVITEPDVVVVMDETLLNAPQANPLSGLKDNGIVFINTAHTTIEAKTKYKIQATVVTLDITKIGLEIFGKPILSALAGGVAARISGLSGDSLRRAIEKEVSGITADETLVAKNVEAALRCFRKIQPTLKKAGDAAHTGSPIMVMPLETAVVAGPTISSMGNAPMRKTGNWRVFKPVWNYDVCTKCLICVARCPDTCIAVNKEGFPFTDYDNCKGCMICAEECPAKAIERVREAHTW